MKTIQQNHLKDIIADMEEAEAMVLKLYEAIKE